MADEKYGYVDFDWKSHRETLKDVFFTEKDVIKRGSEQYKDFWLFLERYQKYQRRKQNCEQDVRNRKHGSKRKESLVLELPEKFDKRYKFNISLAGKDARTLKKLLRSKVDHRGTERDESNSLTVNDLLEFKTIILYYLDFSQKQKFAKLQKLKSDQASLPISQFKDVIVQHVKDHQVVIVAGDTGCGKSTQIPQYLLAAGFSQIACTQPRRIACISLAKRVSYETLNEYGSDVAYQIRFETSKTRHTKILFLTEGLLLRQLSSDPSLSQYNIIVMDEVHERHIHGDFLLGVLKGLVQARSGLKLVLMSATINIELFATYFTGAPVIQVPGRLYPIEVRFMPPSTDSATVQSRASERLDPRPYLHILELIDNKYPANERGDLLIFLSGMSEISAVVDAAEEYAQQTQRWIILPLHSALSIEEQDKVFDVAPEGVRKCIVSTNIAETSVTIDGVRFIVDSGKVKEMSYDSQAKLQKLEEFWISQASAEQRKGRAGRTGPGVCFRLYAESDYDEFSQYSTPEIHRAPLDTIILQMISLGIPDVRSFPFIEPPPKSSIENSIHVLKQQGALNSNEEITPTGEMLAKLPVDVVIGKMLIMGSVFHMIDPVLTIAAAMSVQSPFTRRFSNDPDVMNSRQLLESEHGDPFTLLNAFDEWLHAKGKGSSSRKWCRRRGLEEQRFYEMVKLKEQFEQLLHDHGLLEHKGHNSRERKRENRDKLRKLKREHVKGPRQPKMLKLGQHGIDSDDEEMETDIRDMEFKLTHDLDKLQRSSILRRSFTLRDLNLLKIILCCGLYPQMAIPDEHNMSKNVSDQVFHTTRKQYLVLHPTCVFVSQPDLMRAADKPSTSQDASDDKPRTSRYASDDCRNDHELLSYVSLLETRKPYIMNVMRVPALQTLLLFGRTVDSNADCTRLVVDDWVELGIPDAEHAQKLVSCVIHLRTTWDMLLKRKIEGSREAEEDMEYLEYILSTKLSEFLDSNVNYTIKRLHQTDIEHLYIGSHGYDVRGNHGDDVSGSHRDDVGGSGDNDLAPFLDITRGMSIHPSKGGIKVNDYFTYNDLRNEIEAEASSHAAQFIQKHWTCEICGTKMVVTVLERIEHEKQCSAESKVESAVSEEESKQEPGNSKLERLKKTFYCSECEKEFSFTATEILRHKRTHK